MRATSLLSVVASSLFVSGSVFCQSPADTTIWTDFVRLVRSHEFPVEKIRPVVPGTEQTMLGFVKILGDSVSEEEWGRKPEIHHVGNLVHFVLPLNEGTQRVPYSFSFLVEKGDWFFHHLESITIRLDSVANFPVSSFPDIPEYKKAWIRQEFYWSQMVYLFNSLSKEKGKQAALEFFKDGGGYFLAARVWVPLVTPQRAFILYLCWEQSRLQGNAVTLKSLNEQEAIVRLDPIYFQLYEQSSHLRMQISRDDYDAIFNTIWQDRASNAGWLLAIRREGTVAWLHFARSK